LSLAGVRGCAAPGMLPRVRSGVQWGVTISQNTRSNKYLQF